MSPGHLCPGKLLRMNEERLTSRHAAADVPAVIDEAHHFEHAAGPGQFLFKRSISLSMGFLSSYPPPVPDYAIAQLPPRKYRLRRWPDHSERFRGVTSSRGLKGFLPVQTNEYLTIPGRLTCQRNAILKREKEQVGAGAPHTRSPSFSYLIFTLLLASLSPVT